MEAVQGLCALVVRAAKKVHARGPKKPRITRQARPATTGRGNTILQSIRAWSPPRPIFRGRARSRILTTGGTVRATATARLALRSRTTRFRAATSSSCDAGRNNLRRDHIALLLRISTTSSRDSSDMATPISASDFALHLRRAKRAHRSSLVSKRLKPTGRATAGRAAPLRQPLTAPVPAFPPVLPLALRQRHSNRRMMTKTTARTEQRGRSRPACR